MAGRGVDIKLGGNPTTDEKYKEVLALGGLYVVGTERHESRRIDNQLRGRSGRQGDAGETQFYISTDDDLMRVFGSDRMKSVMSRLGVPDEMAIENKIISKQIELAQKKVEGHNFDIRKRLLDYDDVLNKQRSVTYDMRREIVEKDLSGDVLAYKPLVLEHISDEIDKVVMFHTVDGAEWNIKEIFETMKTLVEVPGDVRARFEKSIGSVVPKAGDAAKVRTELIEELEKCVATQYEALEKLFENRAELAEIEKNLLLRSTDMLWIEHLSAMSKLRSSVGLSGYAQRDPLVEYKRESFAMYQNMMSEVQKQVAYSIFKIKEAVAIARTQSLADRIKIGQTVSTPSKDKKIGRNDPCHCGSGKKFKKCHGA
jgi:preprotein translocase subunit SecA